MGWKREKEEPSRRGFGDLVNPNPDPNSRFAAGEERCSTQMVVRSTCRTEEVQPGRFVRKCEKTEQTLKDCVGRPVELVESKTEHTEDDVTDEVTGGLFPSNSPTMEPFNFPGLHSDIEGIEGRLFGGFGNFLEAADGMANEFFKSFGDPCWHKHESLPFRQWETADGQPKKDPWKRRTRESDSSESAGQMTDV
ncbi:fra a 1-associated protein-like [Musa acuminata AAA Group]|uniref:fra a 1-associated protein-like n=1 Tax=Musa acuminata AAA Group TaxID=214697 RepID=UPI0031DF03BE